MVQIRAARNKSFVLTTLEVAVFIFHITNLGLNQILHIVY